MIEGVALEELHHHVDVALLAVAEAMHPDDARAPERVERLGLAPEADGVLRVLGDVLLEDFDGDGLAGLVVGRGEDDAVPSATELAAERIAPVERRAFLGILRFHAPPRLRCFGHGNRMADQSATALRSAW